MITVPALTCVAMTTVLHGCTPLPVYRVVVVARIFVGGVASVAPWWVC